MTIFSNTIVILMYVRIGKKNTGRSKMGLPRPMGLYVRLHYQRNSNIQINK
jgi:hypothetical protein